MPTAAEIDGLLFPLTRFYPGDLLARLCVEPVAGDAIPEPYRSLLVHRRDMTPTLEAHHGGRIRLRLLDREESGSILLRRVALVLEESGCPVEFGAIAIHLDPFPPAARAVIRECRVPLGTILARFELPHASRPRGYFRLRADEEISGVLALRPGTILYGRRNRIDGGEGSPLADVVEILPGAPAR